MGVSQALFTGVTGLSVNADSMSVIANNIANANSRGFKYDRAEFDDLLSVDLGSGSGGAQMGRGARLSKVKTIHTQGGLAVTDNLTDLAVQGQGFFIVKNKMSPSQESGGMFFTRVGSFNFDKNGVLTDPTGGKIQGYSADTQGNLKTKLTDVRLVTSNIPPQATKKVTFNVNLDARVEAKEDEFDMERPIETSDFNNTVNIFDSHGNSHPMTTYFKRIEDDEGISWQWYATVPSNDVVDPEDDLDEKLFASGLVKFNNEGALVAEETTESSVNFGKGAFQNQVIEFDFGQNIGIEEGTGLGASTATAAESGTVFHSQSGYEAGNLKSLRVDLDGRIRGLYTNGIQRTLGAIALGTFENIDGLQKAGRNQFFKTLESGPPRIGLPQSGTRGSIFSSSLEESNVDLARQFVQMIMTQRGFQANSRSVTTTDSMIEEVVNLKR